MKRRQFIKLSSTASAIGLMPFQVNASLKLMNSFFNCDVSNRKLVLVELAGGNDGLNTVIPISAFTDYQTLRPNIHIPSSLYLPLNQIDTSLTGTNQDIALHPALTGLQGQRSRYPCLARSKKLRMEQAHLLSFHQVNRRAYGLRPHAELSTHNRSCSQMAGRQWIYQS